MNSLIKAAIAYPVAVVAVVIALVVLGISSLNTIPVQLTPDIDKPVLQVRVSWEGGSAADIEREIVLPLERELRNLNGVQSIDSKSRKGSCRVNLTYPVGYDMDLALVKLISQLSRVSSLPLEASEPVVRTSNSDDAPIARLALIALPNQEIDLDRLTYFIEDAIVDPLNRISGVAEITSWGGTNREIRVVLDTDRVAGYGLSISEIASAISSSTAEITAGEITEGKRSFTLRTEAISYTPEAARQLVLRSERIGNQVTTVKLSDVATVNLDYKPPNSFRRLNGQPAITFAVLREPAANVVSILDALKLEVGRLNSDVLAERGLSLKIVYDETVYIGSAIDLVQTNMLVGGILAFSVLLIFLRSLYPALVVMIAIPVSMLTTLFAISALGLSINVISLAGLAFAVGMVVDSSIIALENIYRLHQSGVSLMQAAYWGARQVWAPILGSALTTVVVFIPILSLDLPVGQLFRDIAVAISVSVLVSVFVSVTVIPALASKILKNRENERVKSIPIIDTIATKYCHVVMAYCRSVVRSGAKGLVMVFILIFGATCLTIFLTPPLDYLPDGNRNFVFGRIFVPPGYTRDATLDFAQSMEDVARPMWENQNPRTGPHIDRFFFVAFDGGAFAGAATSDAARIRELIPLLSEPVIKTPGAKTFITQASLFGRSVGGSRAILIDVVGPDLEAIQPVAREVGKLTRRLFPAEEGHQIRVLPAENSNRPEVVIRPDYEALARAGLTARDFGQALDVYNDGIRVREIPFEGDLIDLVLTAETSKMSRLEDIPQIPIVTSDGSTVRIEQVASVEFESTPDQIIRKTGQRAITIQLRPHESVPLEDAIATIRTEITKPFDLSKRENVRLKLSGAADELSKAWNAMQTNIFLAICIIYLLLTVLLRSFLLPVIILVTVPIAASGGILGLWILNRFIEQPFDMLTLLGFIILTGVVVNNAILLVEQTLWHIHNEGMLIRISVLEATKNRIRPICMSTATSLFGLFPLVIFSGAGSELYRGIGVVVFSGLLVSTVLTVFFVPPLLAAILNRHLPKSSGKHMDKIAIPIGRKE